MVATVPSPIARRPGAQTNSQDCFELSYVFQYTTWFHKLQIVGECGLVNNNNDPPYYCSGKGIHLLIIISGQGEKLETKLGLQGEMEK